MSSARILSSLFNHASKARPLVLNVQKRTIQTTSNQMVTTTAHTTTASPSSATTTLTTAKTTIPKSKKMKSDDCYSTSKPCNR
eukprot:Pgem_evm1s1724